MSDVTNSWGRTFRALIMLLGLAILVCAGAAAAAMVGSSVASPLLQLIG